MSERDDERDGATEDDAARKAILARRASFIAAAVASVGIACGKTTATTDPAPMVCLSVAVPEPPDAEPPVTPATAPTPCLTVAFDYDASPPRDGGAAKDAGAKPKGKP